LKLSVTARLTQEAPDLLSRFDVVGPGAFKAQQFYVMLWALLGKGAVELKGYRPAILYPFKSSKFLN
jgi:hypothetical protein